MNRNGLSFSSGRAWSAAKTATRDLPDGRGGVVPAADIQRGVPTGLGDSLAVAVEDARAWE